MSAYYNEIDPFCAQWLRNLIAAGHIATGEVDERSITEVEPDDLRGFDQCHFFAGIGVWSYALRLAGWPDDRPVWTGSCPCQPFSAAGKRKGADDERHLAPSWLRLIRECKPSVVFGEQVGAAIGIGWLDALFVEMESIGYACGAVDFPACSVGAPHIRQRVYFVAHSSSSTSAGEHRVLAKNPRQQSDEGPESSYECSTGELADAECGAAERHGHGMGEAQGDSEGEVGQQRLRDDVRDGLATGELADANGRHAGAEWLQRGGEHGLEQEDGDVSFWSDATWLPCRDGKARPTKPGIFPLAHGASARVGRLRAYGNAIVAPQAAEFIRAYLESFP